MRKPARYVAVIAVLFVAACSDSPQAPPAPTPGVVDVYLLTAHAGDRAALLSVTGPVTGFEPASGFQHFENANAASLTLLLVSASALPQGDVRVGSFRIDDVERAGSIRVVVTEVASADYQVRENTGDYVVTTSLR
jgi:hypothetical protein